MKLFRRGQLGKIITSIPVFISIFVILGFYLVFVGFVFGIRGASVPSSVKGVEFGDVLFKEIEVNGEKMNFLDGIIRADIYSKKIFLREEVDKYINYMGRVKDGLKVKLEKDSQGQNEEICFILHQGYRVVPESVKISGNGKDIYYRFKNAKAEIGSGNDILFYYQSGKLVKVPSFKVNGNDFEKRYEILYYYGRCLR